jgi:hypothetical protein
MYQPSGWQPVPQLTNAKQLASTRVIKAGFAGVTSALSGASGATGLKAAAPSCAENFASKQAPPPLATHFSRRTTQAAGKQNKQ